MWQIEQNVLIVCETQQMTAPNLEKTTTFCCVKIQRGVNGVSQRDRFVFHCSSEGSGGHQRPPCFYSPDLPGCSAERFSRSVKGPGVTESQEEPPPPGISG